jgi:phosphotransferase system HPr (HPr) family protein
MPDLHLTVLDPAGLHGRPAARFVQIASRFGSAVTLRVGERTANAKSMVGLLGLAVRPESEITISAEGDDAEAALAALLAELGSAVEPTERGPAMPP